jgi:hypothetical protein
MKGLFRTQSWREGRSCFGEAALSKNCCKGWFGWKGYFFLEGLRLVPKLFLAAFSQPERLEPCFLWQAFSAAASFWARSCAAVFALGQPVTLIGVD